MKSKIKPDELADIRVTYNSDLECYEVYLPAEDCSRIPTEAMVRGDIHEPYYNCYLTSAKRLLRQQLFYLTYKPY